MIDARSVIIEEFFVELSRERRRNFKMAEFIKLSKYGKGTIYNKFDNINQLYDSTFQLFVVQGVLQSSTSVKFMLEALVEYISANQIFCMNLYDLFEPDHIQREDYLFQIFDQQLQRLKIEDAILRYYLITGFLATLDKWFRYELGADSATVITNLHSHDRLMIVK